MVDKKTIRMQLAAIDADLPFWVKPEVRELSRIIVPGETIQHVISGRYENGFALLCATNMRILIIDKKPIFLAVEDVRYDMIAEVNYTHQLIDATIHLAAFNKDFWFNSFRKKQLYALTDHIQHKLSEVRQGVTEEQPSMLVNALVAENNVTQEQAREILPGTQQAWDRISKKLHAINTMSDHHSTIRRRVTKFDTFQ